MLKLHKSLVKFAQAFSKPDFMGRIPHTPFAQAFSKSLKAK